MILSSVRRKANTTTGDATNGTEKILQKNVYFYPRVNGNKVYGTFRICISIGSNGEVVGIEKLANEYELINEVETKNFEEIEKSFSQNEYTLNSETSSKNLEVNSISHAFYADPESEYIQPIYVFEGNNSAEDDYSIWMDAVKHQ